MAPRIHHVQQHHLPLPGLEAMSLLTEQHFSRHAHEQFGPGISFAVPSARGVIRAKADASAGQIIMVNPEKCTMAYC